MAIPQTCEEPGWVSVCLFGEKRLPTTCKRACSSSAGSPDELIGKQYRISPKSFTATRNRSVSGVSSSDVAKPDCGTVGVPNSSSSLEKEMYVLGVPLVEVVVRAIECTTPGGWELGIFKYSFDGGSSLRIGSTAE